MPFATEREAKGFLVEKIRQQSELEDVSISEVERCLLLYSVEEPESAVGIPEDEGYDTPEWESRMTALLRRAWQRDHDDPMERQLYLDAMKRLKAGDHYIQVIAGPVFDGWFSANASVSGFPVISLRRVALWSAAGIVLFAIIALVCVALTR